MTDDVKETFAGDPAAAAFAEALGRYACAAESPGLAERIERAVSAAAAAERRRAAFVRILARAGAAAAAAAAVAVAAFCIDMHVGVRGGNPPAETAPEPVFARIERIPSDFRDPVAVCAFSPDGPCNGWNVGESVARIIQKQRADGGWGNPVLSSWCTAALAKAAAEGFPGAGIARMKALRHLRMNGIEEKRGGELLAAAASGQFARFGIL